MQQLVEKTYRAINFDVGPIVGIQIRRTDKVIKEAKYYSISDYFHFAELWFTLQEKYTSTKLKRRIYIAAGIN
jgi:hypothetical protein